MKWLMKYLQKYPNKAIMLKEYWLICTLKAWVQNKISKKLKKCSQNYYSAMIQLLLTD